MSALSQIDELWRRELFPDSPVAGVTFLATKLIEDIDEMAILCADISRLHELTVMSTESPVVGDPLDWGNQNVAVPGAAWYEKAIISLLSSAREHPGSVVGSGRISVQKTQSGYNVAFDIGSLSIADAEKLLRNA